MEISPKREVLRVRLTLDISPIHHPCLLDRLMKLPSQLASTCVLGLAEACCSKLPPGTDVWFLPINGRRRPASTYQPLQIKVNKYLDPSKYPTLVAFIRKCPEAQRALLLATLAEHSLAESITSGQVHSDATPNLQAPTPQPAPPAHSQPSDAGDRPAPQANIHKPRRTAMFANFVAGATTEADSAASRSGST